MTRLLIIFSALLLTACGAEERRVAAPPVVVDERVASRFGSVEVLEVSLPTSAAGEEIMIEDADGALILTELLWADDPARAMTLQLTRNLTEITGATIAPEPWPFDGFAAARLDVRVERFVAGPTGAVTLSGQYFVADLDGRGRDRARLFSLTTQTSGLTVSDAARARSALVADLALLIARDGL